MLQPSDVVPNLFDDRRWHRTWLQQMYGRWKMMSAIEEFRQGANPWSLGWPVFDFKYEIKKPAELNAMFGYIPQPPPEPEIVCPCCKGSGTYTGFTSVEPCGECKGTGKVKGKLADQPGAKGSPDVDYGALGL